MDKKNMPSGGKRTGAGRKSKYGEQTSVVRIRVPNSKKDVVLSTVAKLLKKWEVKKPKK